MVACTAFGAIGRDRWWGGKLLLTRVFSESNRRFHTSKGLCLKLSRIESSKLLEQHAGSRSKMCGPTAHSLDRLNILFDLESEFDIEIDDEEAKKVTNVGEMVAGITQLVDAKGTASPAS